ncbi:Hypothetical predicted protein [Mytilus galloprovincialis]|uniref:Uncharacterized protein n=1 Tax=Mytilus galloprovincialis TaxID=29158 RepID=A0A8B6FN08_MYTGA|nr:Hypothetical predicted protein [Mytilus galloprovincialis]
MVEEMYLLIGQKNPCSCLGGMRIQRVFLLAAVFTLISNNWRIPTKEIVAVSLENLKDPSLSIRNDELHPDGHISMEIHPTCNSKDVISEYSDVAEKNADGSPHNQDRVNMKSSYEKFRHNLRNGYKAVDTLLNSSDNDHILEQDLSIDECTHINVQ